MKKSNSVLTSAVLIFVIASVDSRILQQSTEKTVFPALNESELQKEGEYESRQLMTTELSNIEKENGTPKIAERILEKKCILHCFFQMTKESCNNCEGCFWNTKILNPLLVCEKILQK